MPTNDGSDWIKPIASAFAAVALMAGGVWAVGISPVNMQIEKLIVGREKDGDQLAKLYTSIQTNDEYKKVVETELKWIKSDLAKLGTLVARVDDEQKRRASTIASVDSVIKRIDRIDTRTEEAERRSSPLLIDEVKALRAELESLRQRIMVPLASTPH
jgi:hypothetical protein